MPKLKCQNPKSTGHAMGCLLYIALLKGQEMNSLGRLIKSAQMQGDSFDRLRINSPEE